MSWVRLDDGLPTHPKIAGLSDAAFRLYVTALCYAGQHLTDGVVVVAALHRSKPGAVRELLAARLFEKIGNDIVIHDYLDYQLTRAAVLEMRERNRAAGAKGGKARAANAEASAKQDAKQDAKRDASATLSEVLSEVSSEGSSEIQAHPIPSPPILGNEEKTGGGPPPSFSSKGNGKDPLTKWRLPIKDSKPWRIPLSCIEPWRGKLTDDTIHDELDKLVRLTQNDPFDSPRAARAKVASWLERQVTFQEKTKNPPEPSPSGNPTVNSMAPEELDRVFGRKPEEPS